MKILSLVLFVFLSSFHLIYAQNNENVASQAHELGLRFSGFDDFNLMYKKRLDDGRYRRHRIGNASLNFNSNRDQINFSLAYAFGNEKRKLIGDNFFFVHGWEYSIFSSYSNVQTNNGRASNTQLTPSIGYIIGFQKQLSESVYLSAEIIPNLNGSFFFDGSDFGDFRLGTQFNSGATGLSLFYQFTKN